VRATTYTAALRANMNIEGVSEKVFMTSVQSVAKIKSTRRGDVSDVKIAACTAGCSILRSFNSS
jgi:hypothetical protein